MQFTSPPPSPVLELFRDFLPPLFLFALFAVLARAALMLLRGRNNPSRQGVASGKRESAETTGKLGALDRALQGKVESKALFNKSELRLFRLLDREVRSSALPYYVMGQASMLAFIATDSKYKKHGSFPAVKGRYVDLAVVDAEGNVVLVVEYNGPGHFSNNSEERDKIKATLLQKAGIPFLPVVEADADAEIIRRFREKLEIGAAGTT